MTTTPKRSRGRPRKAPEDVGETYPLRLSASLRSRAQAAADTEGVDLSEWVREAIEERLADG
jgi:predicted HicB family RNase H-like nuclease